MSKILQYQNTCTQREREREREREGGGRERKREFIPLSLTFLTTKASAAASRPQVLPSAIIPSLSLFPYFTYKT